MASAISCKKHLLKISQYKGRYREVLLRLSWHLSHIFLLYNRLNCVFNFILYIHALVRHRGDFISFYLNQSLVLSVCILCDGTEVPFIYLFIFIYSIIIIFLQSFNSS